MPVCACAAAGTPTSQTTHLRREGASARHRCCPRGAESAWCWTGLGTRPKAGCRTVAGAATDSMPLRGEAMAIARRAAGCSHRALGMMCLRSTHRAPGKRAPRTTRALRDHTRAPGLLTHARGRVHTAGKLRERPEARGTQLRAATCTKRPSFGARQGSKEASAERRPEAHRMHTHSGTT